jgi:hypothetical protein
MLIGYTLIASASKYYSPWRPQGGDTAEFLIDMRAIGASTTFNVAIETKGRDDPDPTTGQLASFDAITTTGLKKKEATGVLDLWRLRYEVTGAGSFRFVEFDVPEPGWKRR